MADSQIEIHDPFINNPERREDDEAASSSDTEDMEDTPEFRLLMAYAKRRRGNVESPGQNGNGAPPPSSPPISTQTTDDEKPKKKKKKKKIWKRFFRCIKPQTRDEEPDQAPDPEHNATNRCGFSGSEAEENDDFESAAKCLTRIADDIPFVSSDLETDSPNDNVERMIGLLLRKAGDELNERELKDLSLLRGLWHYGFFERVMTTLLTRMGFRSSDPESPGPQASHEAQIAATLEATTRLSVMETLPMNQINNYGARYVKENHSSWAQEHGGYEAAFEAEEEEECD